MLFTRNMVSKLPRFPKAKLCCTKRNPKKTRQETQAVNRLAESCGLEYISPFVQSAQIVTQLLNKEIRIYC
jgi:hypothetical protein